MLKQIFAALCGVLVFVVFLFAFKRAGVAAAVVLGVAAYIACVLMFLKPRNKTIIESDPSDAVSKEAIAETIREGGIRIAEIRTAMHKIGNREIRNKIDSVCGIADSILDDFRRNPKHLKNAKRFTLYYLDATNRIVDRYSTVSANPVKTPETEAVLQRTEDVLELIDDTFRKQLGKLTDGELMDLDVEITLLEKTIKSEGL